MNEQVAVILVAATPWPEQFITGSWMCAQVHIGSDVFFLSYHSSTMLKLNWNDQNRAEVSSRFTDKSPSADAGVHSELLLSLS